MNSRLFSDYYDSILQRVHWSYLDSNLEDSKYLYIGRLRFDTLLSEKLVLLDTQLLDGAIFLGISPQDILPSISRRHLDSAPIEIRSRSLDLEEALLGFVKLPNGQPKRFSFSSIKNIDQRKHVEEELAQFNVQSVNSYKDVLAILAQMSVSKENIGVIEKGWTSWIEAQKAGRVEVKKWGPNFERDRALGNLGSLLGELRTEEGKDKANWVYLNRGNRSDVDVELSQAKKHWKNKQLVDVFHIEAWYHRGYDYAAAWQNDCGIVESTFASAISMLDLDQSSGDYSNIPVFHKSGLDLHVDDDFIHALGKIPPDQYQSLFLRSEEHFRNWWLHRNISELKRAIDPFSNQMSKEGWLFGSSQTDKVLLAAVPLLFTLLDTLANVPNGALLTLFSRLVVQFFNKIDRESPQRVLVERIFDIATDRIDDNG